jgi:phage N-6-adenine-methyltransferase
MQKLESENQDGTATPQWLFDLLNQQVEAQTGCRFDVDAAASAWNAKCPYFWDEEADGLKQDWLQRKNVFLNAPFEPTILERFVNKALDASRSGVTVVLIVPTWPGYPWFQQLKQHGYMQDIVGPVVFHRFDGTSVTFGNGPKKTDLSVFTLGPKARAGTNGPPISAKSMADDGGATPIRIAEERRPRGGHRLLSDIEPKPTDWLWQLRLPLGELSVIDGDPGVNKSSMLLDLAARVSNGSPMPDGTAGVSGGVLLMLAEDSIAKTVVGRLSTAGANLEQIAVLDHHTRIPRHCSALRTAAHQISAKLIVIDPIMAFLQPDSNADQKVRQALSPLAEIAEELNAAIILVRHLNKRGGTTSLYRGSGSIGIIGAARSGLLIGRSPENSDLRVLCHVKSNLGPLAPSLLFESVDAAGLPQIEWRGECDLQADDLLVSAKNQRNRLSDAAAFLEAILADGPVEQRIVMKRAILDGLACRTVERAKELLGVVSKRKGWGPGSTCHWCLPDADDHSTPTDEDWRAMET